MSILNVPLSGNLDEHGNFHGYTMLKVLPSVSCIKGRRCQLDGCRFQSCFLFDSYLLIFLVEKENRLLGPK